MMILHSYLSLLEGTSQTTALHVEKNDFDLGLDPNWANMDRLPPEEQAWVQWPASRIWRETLGVLQRPGWNRGLQLWLPVFSVSDQKSDFLYLLYVIVHVEQKFGF